MVTVAGAVGGPGVYEIPLGATVADVLRRAKANRPRGVLVGGYSGRWVDGTALGATTLDSGTIGAGVVAVVDDATCAVAEMARVAAWYSMSSAGQCGACTWGLKDLARASGDLVSSGGGPRVGDIRRWSAMVKGRGGCRLPDGAASFLESGLQVFADEIEEHHRGICSRPDLGLLRTPRPEPFR